METGTIAENNLPRLDIAQYFRNGRDCKIQVEIQPFSATVGHPYLGIEGPQGDTDYSWCATSIYGVGIFNTSGGGGGKWDMEESHYTVVVGDTVYCEYEVKYVYGIYYYRRLVRPDLFGFGDITTNEVTLDSRFSELGDATIYMYSGFSMAYYSRVGNPPETYTANINSGEPKLIVRVA